jgi:hypothetical protein
MYMELPIGVEMRDGNQKMHVLKLLKNLYGQKQVGRVWNQHLVKGLCPVLDEAMGFLLLKLLALALFDCRGGSMENYDFSFIIFLGRKVSFLCKIVFIPVSVHDFSVLIISRT